ncbi:AraC family transcriptional regulator [Polyangium sp. 6x1]|uniref:AraC family transcriptional regulator n=1 Tax=Polyangium sp. 6x1 TaxID=3042689 RepID=UPI00248314C7|nr:AraC family transcriptional regulator [Polyangium sp. 6x1]MDI1447050.1 AraC family transcriptional regulator ligand-binding domain-containing protein [Polyangium sp. 6x1]
MSYSKDPMRHFADSSRQKTLSASLISPFVLHASRAGWSEEELTDRCAHHGIRRAALDDLTARVPQAGALALLKEICARSRDENLGIHLAREADPSWMSLPGVLGMTLTSVRDAIEIGGYYGRRLDSSAPNRRCHVRDDGLLHLSYVLDPRDAAWPRQLVEAGIGAIVVILRRFTGVDIKATRVSFPHAAPADPAPHVALFGTTDLRFEAPFVELVLPASVLDLRHQSADPGLAAYLRRQADALVEQVAREDDIVEAVRQSLREALDGAAEASLGSAARRLGVTSRTLQRHLAEAGVRFSALLEGVRYEMAVALLDRSGKSLDEIAEQVGFSDARSLRRALKRHSGRTPSALRRGNDGGA